MVYEALRVETLRRNARGCGKKRSGEAGNAMVHSDNEAQYYVSTFVCLVAVCPSLPT